MAIKQRSKSLQARDSALSDTFYQLQVLNDHDLTYEQLPQFTEVLANHGYLELRPQRIEILQVNVGKLCNQTCAHCHVDAGPDRTEVMSRAHLEQCLEILATHDIPTVDITGGAPEMNPHFRWFVEECARLGKHIMDRCNLTIIVANPKYRDLPAFFAEHKVQVISSLP
ncbi:MAG: radical SAM protein, partial [Saprospiraceae bacterium]|nr:radical SAM protein [Saprospiraceae bacterium]